MNASDSRLLAWAQIIGSILIFGLVAASMLCFEMGLAHLNADQLKIYERDSSWLKDAALLILYFWYQRSRQGGIPDPGQVITQTHTSPDGTKTTVTAPVNAPPASVPSLPSTTAPLVSTQEKKV
jgi:hypothetical protein